MLPGALLSRFVAFVFVTAASYSGVRAIAVFLRVRSVVRQRVLQNLSNAVLLRQVKVLLSRLLSLVLPDWLVANRYIAAEDVEGR